ncbi:MAG: hypothetical protein WBD34_24945 [Burkholderiaceae bacterium]
MHDDNARFARLVYLCEKVRKGEHPTMNDVEGVAVALALRRVGWLKYRGYTRESAQAFIGARMAAVLDRVGQTLDDC